MWQWAGSLRAIGNRAGFGRVPLGRRMGTALVRATPPVLHLAGCATHVEKALEALSSADFDAAIVDLTLERRRGFRGEAAMDLAHDALAVDGRTVRLSE